MPRHIMTTDERRRGGWTRARQLAYQRRKSPSKAEERVHQALIRLNYTFMREWEFWNDFGPFPQWADVFISDLGVMIEVDGSNGWHRDYLSSKMRKYDQAKRLWCEHNDIRLIVIDNNSIPDDAELREMIEGKDVHPR